MHVDHAEVQSRFVPHPMSPEQAARAEKVRFHFAGVVAGVLAETKPGRAQSLALTHLEEASFFAIAAIARESV